LRCLYCVSAYHARAQTSKRGEPRRVGFIARMNPSETVELERLFWSAMSKRGWVRDENVVVERANVDELIRRRVEVILAIGQTQPVTAARATRTIPIVDNRLCDECAQSVFHRALIHRAGN